MASDAGDITLVVTPPPTPNGPLHVGHLSGPYLAGDIAVRAARAAGRNVVSVCGLDAHQNYVLARAEAMGKSGVETANHFAELIRDALRRSRVEYDLFIDPLADADYRDGVARLLTELVAAKAIVVDEVPLPVCGQCGRTLHHVRVSGSCSVCGAGAAAGTCEECGSFLTATTLTDAKSGCCQAAPTTRTARLPVLRLEEVRDKLLEVWGHAVMPARVRTLISRYLVDGLPDVLLAYPSDWGITWQHDGEELRIDVWAEMALGYLYAVARHVEPSAHSLSDCVAAWRRIRNIWHTLGIDNAFYYSTLIPALLVTAGLPTTVLGGLVVNEFYRLDGLKFSTSRNHAIWAHEFLAETDPGVVRAFLAWSRPDVYGTDFTMPEFEAFADFYRAVTEGSAAGTTLDTTLAQRELERAERALRLESFDAAVAVRCALAAYPVLPDAAAAVLSHLTGATHVGGTVSNGS